MASKQKKDVTPEKETKKPTKKKSAAKPEAKKAEKEVIDNPSSPAPVGEEVRPDDETVAAMVAAIAALSETTADKIRIKSIRKIK